MQSKDVKSSKLERIKIVVKERIKRIVDTFTDSRLRRLNIVTLGVMYIINFLFYSFIAKALYLINNVALMSWILWGNIFVVFILLLVSFIFLTKGFKAKQLSLRTFVLIYFSSILMFTNVNSIANMSSDFYSSATAFDYYKGHYDNLKNIKPQMQQKIEIQTYSIDNTLELDQLAVGLHSPNNQLTKEEYDLLTPFVDNRRYHYYYFKNDAIGFDSSEPVRWINGKTFVDKFKIFLSREGSNNLNNSQTEDQRRYVQENMIYTKFNIYCNALIEDFYYAVQVTSTLGFGNITPQFTSAMFFTSLIVIYHQFLAFFGVALVVNRLNSVPQKSAVLTKRHSRQKIRIRALKEQNRSK